MRPAAGMTASQTRLTHVIATVAVPMIRSATHRGMSYLRLEPVNEVSSLPPNDDGARDQVMKRLPALGEWLNQVPEKEQERRKEAGDRTDGGAPERDPAASEICDHHAHHALARRCLPTRGLEPGAIEHGESSEHRVADGEIGDGHDVVRVRRSDQ